MKNFKIFTLLLLITIVYGGESNSSFAPLKLYSELKVALNREVHPISDINNRKLLKRFYRDNNYTSIWFSNGELSERHMSLFRAIEGDITINRDGKLYREYKNTLGYLKSKERDNLHTELYLSSLYIDFLQHLIYGEINWRTFQFKLKKMRRRGINGYWVTYRPDFNLSELLTTDVDRAIDEVTPKRFGYGRLIKSLEILRDLKSKGGWEKLPKFKRLRLGDSGLAVIKLRKRLMASKDLNVCDAPSSLFEIDEDSINSDVKIQPDANFDKCLEDGVKRFQSRHGLSVDGVVGPATRRALDITVDEKIDRVLLNIDRVKWLPRDVDERYIIVNIPEFMLHYIDGGREIRSFPRLSGWEKEGDTIPPDFQG